MAVARVAKSGRFEGVEPRVPALDHQLEETLCAAREHLFPSHVSKPGTRR